MITIPVPQHTLLNGGDATATLLRIVIQKLDDGQKLQQPYGGLVTVQILESASQALRGEPFDGDGPTITVPSPEIAHPGNQSAADYMKRAGWNIDNGYDVGGSNVTRAVLDLLENVAKAVERFAVEHPAPGAPAGDAPLATGSAPAGNAPSPFLSVDGNQTWFDPADPTGLAYRLNYGTPTSEDLTVASSVVRAYSALFEKPKRVRDLIFKQVSQLSTVAAKNRSGQRP